MSTGWVVVISVLLYVLGGIVGASVRAYREPAMLAAYNARAPVSYDTRTPGYTDALAGYFFASWVGVFALLVMALCERVRLSSQRALARRVALEDDAREQERLLREAGL